jgi:hypothetical protein
LDLCATVANEAVAGSLGARETAETWENPHEVNNFPGLGLSLRLAVLGEIAGRWRPKKLSDRVSDVLSGMQSTTFRKRPEAG